MEILIGRQAILDRKNRTFGYELLYRETALNNTSKTDLDGNTATSRVIVNAFLNLGIDKLAKKGRVFINFTRDLIIDRVWEMLPKEKVVIEVLEDVIAEEEILKSLSDAKKQGYKIALDDFVFLGHLEELVKLADIIKVDFLELKKEEIVKQVEKYKKFDLTLLAEKVETEQDHKFALELGFKLFQGYYFTKPVIEQKRELAPYQANILKALKVVNDPASELEDLIDIVSSDLYLNTKLLSMINSPYFGIKTTVKTAKKAISLLGHKKTREWLNILLVSKLGEDKPQELAVISTVRARFAKLLSKPLELDEDNAYYLGLYSLIDTMLNADINEILKEMEFLDSEVKDALLGKKNPYRELLDFIINFENGDFNRAEEFIKKHKLDKENINTLYIDAIQFADSIYYS